MTFPNLGLLPLSAEYSFAHFIKNEWQKISKRIQLSFKDAFEMLPNHLLQCKKKISKNTKNFPKFQ